MDPLSYRECAEELLKLAVRVPFIHGTSGRWDVLRPGVGETVLRNDPNPRAVYTAMKNRIKRPLIEQFAREAVEAKGGEPVLAVGKMDTRKGWRPSQLTLQGRKEIGSVEDAAELLGELEAAQEPRRGEIWRTLHRGVGSWTNEDPAATLRPTKYQPVPDSGGQHLKVAMGVLLTRPRSPRRGP